MDVTVHFTSIEEVPSDLRDRLRMGVDGKYFVSQQDISGAQLKRLIQLCDEKNPDKKRELLRSPSDVDSNFEISREQARDTSYYARVKAAAEKVGQTVRVVDEPRVVKKRFLLTRSEARDIELFKRKKAEAEAEGCLLEVVDDDEVVAAK